jgi:hypothetical protein
MPCYIDSTAGPGDGPSHPFHRRDACPAALSQDGADGGGFMPKKLTTVSILNLWGELDELYRQLGDPALTTKGEATIEARVKEIGAQLFPAGLPDPMGRDFWTLFKRHRRSSGDCADYWRLQNALFVEIAEESAQGHRENLNKLSGGRWNRDGRDMQMAREFRRLKKTSDLKDSRLKAVIGHKHRLGRSASIEGVNRGEELLDRPPKAATTDDPT